MLGKQNDFVEGRLTERKAVCRQDDKRRQTNKRTGSGMQDTLAGRGQEAEEKTRDV